MLVEKPKSLILNFNGSVPEKFVIFRNDGTVFHFRDLPPDMNEIMVNFPYLGEFYFSHPATIVKESNISVPFWLPKLPIPNRNRIKPVTIQHSNGGFLEINTETGTIYVSGKFYEIPLQCQDFLIEHEYGHFMYLEEEKCDLFAYVACMRKGLNESMCFYAMSYYLNRTPENIERMKRLYNIIVRS